MGVLETVKPLVGTQLLAAVNKSQSLNSGESVLFQIEIE